MSMTKKVAKEKVKMKGDMIRGGLRSQNRRRRSMIKSIKKEAREHTMIESIINEIRKHTRPLTRSREDMWHLTLKNTMSTLVLLLTTGIHMQF